MSNESWINEDAEGELNESRYGHKNLHPAPSGPFSITGLNTFKDLAVNFYDALDADSNQYAGACDICGMVKFEKKLPATPVPRSSVDLSWVYSTTLTDDDDILICNECRGHLNNSKAPPLSLHNIGNIPREQPECLKKLTMSEIILLSPARAFMTLKRLKFGSFASTGNSITLAQDAQRICNSLPRALSELKEHITIVLVDSTQVPHFHRGLDKEILKKHCPELVIRRRVWREAWDYLKTHSPAYEHITLDESTLATLPEDGIPDAALDTVSSSNDTRIENPDLGPGQVADEVEDGAEFDEESIRPIHTSTLRTTPNVMTAGASINASSNTKIILSTRLGDPLSEFTDSLYFHKCFPTLFLMEKVTSTRVDQTKSVYETG